MSGIPARSWRLAPDHRGVAALEFALIAPFMMMMFMGTIELSNAFRVQAKVNTAAGQLAELIASQPSVTAPGGSLADMCKGAALNILPYGVSLLSADVASVTNDHPVNRVAGSTDTTSIKTYLDWENVSSCAGLSSAMGLAGAYDLANTPSSLLTRSGTSAASAANLAYNYSAVVIVVKYRYNNILTFLLGSPVYFKGTTVARPRSNVTITCTNTAGTLPCPALQ